MNREQKFTQFRRKQIAELRPYVPGEGMEGVSVSQADMLAGSPKQGDMIARNPKNHEDVWLVAAQYFADNFEPLAALSAPKAEAVEKPHDNEEADQRLMKFLVKSIGGHSVTIVREGKRLIGWCAGGKGRSIAMRDLREEAETVPAITDEAVERAAKAMYDLKPFHGLDNRPDPIPWPEYALANPELAQTIRAKAHAALLAAFPSKGEGE